MSQNVPDFAALLQSAEHSAVHLEMRDVYAVGNEVDAFEYFKRTGESDLDPDSPFWMGWTPLVREAVGRGVKMRRARIVSEPVTDYIRWEIALTPVNIAVGEEVRWLPRRLASDLALPGNDLWLIDNRRVLFHWFTGDGDWAGHEFNEDPAVVKMVSDAFEAVWERAIPHEKYPA
ncbi:hypothetical protein Sipo8835_36915 [Streptomyces ipomoeae]|uniref:DUF6879 domain-containing protein n=2 Tax=Streptomyces ipomoeae TaxID=103232 RepID=L1KU56_9ACTN|nr:DUF6879 family protein [Streptomyces ipomoeae]EKX63923.1 hypothetical protein STRIP9103_04943 [Streptomyces ipomoeae 91-03]MDX2694831.1 hypothetical protein [Streptomyces ipomoeae]MDX2824587.1 hypothetical protein [Streptomyces ipomoeae]MDX2842879.1 hypothetical protein [Streptomyces ipomoeae]MDX2877255.1 hypothetical protein [Streptomyces ipomoeae]